MTNLCFVHHDSKLTADLRPVTETAFTARVEGSDPLKWWFLAPGYGYDPYIVRFVSHGPGPAIQ